MRRDFRRFRESAVAKDRRKALGLADQGFLYSLLENTWTCWGGARAGQVPQTGKHVGFAKFPKNGTQFRNAADQDERR